MGQEVPAWSSLNSTTVLAKKLCYAMLIKILGGVALIMVNDFLYTDQDGYGSGGAGPYRPRVHHRPGCRHHWLRICRHHKGKREGGITQRGSYVICDIQRYYFLFCSPSVVKKFFN